MNIQVQSLKAIHIVSDILVLGFFNEMAPPKGLAGEIDWVLNNSLSLLIKSKKISGQLGEGALISSEKIKTPKIYWVGLGKREEYNHSLISKFAPDLYDRLEKLGVKEAYLDLWDIDRCHLDFFSALNAFLNGIFQKGIGGNREAIPDRPPNTGKRGSGSASRSEGLGGIGGNREAIPDRPPNTIDLIFHTRDKDRTKEMNRLLKEVDIKSKSTPRVTF